MREAARATVAVAALLVGPVTGAIAGEPGPVRILLRVQNVAGVGTDTLGEARLHVERIYAAADIELLWREEATTEAADVRLILIVAREPSTRTSSPKEALGVAAVPTSGCGRVAYALWDRIATLARTRGRPAATVLGHVIAHELGHLVLPARSHAASGIMRAQWRRADLDDAERKVLVFSAQQARAMRRRILDQSPQAARC